MVAAAAIVVAICATDSRNAMAPQFVARTGNSRRVAERVHCAAADLIDFKIQLQKGCA